MRTACLISHHDYGEFLGEAVDSVLAQTRVPDEVVLVDDGSAPAHRDVARRVARRSERVRLLEKPNGGQLSAFQAGLEQVTADVCFYLDADDRWNSRYVERVSDLLRARPDVGFVATHHCELHDDGRLRTEPAESRDLGFSLVRCLETGGAWVGVPTSGLALRREVLDKIFPVPNVEGWRICADEALVYGSSLAGARKFFLGEPLVEYRVHDDNAFHGRRPSAELAYHRRLEGRRLTEHLRRRFSLPATLVDIAHYEFRTIERPTRLEYRHYRSIVRRSGVGWRRKVRLLTELFRTYHFGRGRDSGELRPLPSPRAATTEQESERHRARASV